MALNILIADDEPSIARLLSYNIEKMDFTPITVQDGEACIEALEQTAVSALLLDINMPKKNGFEVLSHVQTHFPHIPVIMITAMTTIETAVKAIKMGAYDYLIKPIDLDRLRTILKNSLDMWQLRTQVDTLQEQLRQSELFTDMIGESQTLKDMFNLLHRVLETNVNVMIVGESGTGKELLARAIHRGSTRRNGPFVAVNSAAIPQQLADSLFLGHKKGAFTGAGEDQAGYFEQAHNGTIFLDEIGDMPLELQAKVLRILEERTVRRLGENRERLVDFRVVSATNRDLTNAMAEHAFRNDLYFRLEEYPIYVPSLRERRDDIPLLAQHFLQDFCISNSLPVKRFSPDAIHQLMYHNWPGNIRELKNLVRREAIKCPENLIEQVHIAGSEVTKNTLKTNPTTSHSKNQEISSTLEDMEREAIERAYYLTDGNAIEAAKALGISRATMYRKLKNYGIDE